MTLLEEYWASLRRLFTKFRVQRYCFVLLRRNLNLYKTVQEERSAGENSNSMACS